MYGGAQVKSNPMNVFMQVSLRPHSVAGYLAVWIFREERVPKSSERLWRHAPVVLTNAIVAFFFVCAMGTAISSCP